MQDMDPVAFLSYVRADDEHDHGKITLLRSRLEGEVRMQTGRSFKIFQDKREISWGQQWKERLEKTILNVTFLIPVVTPSYFTSQACRGEFEQFLLREKQLGMNTLILLIYYVSSDEIDSERSGSSDSIANILSTRNWSDWRQLRFKDVIANDVSLHVAEMAKTIKEAMKSLDAVIAASRVQPAPPSPLAKQKVHRLTQSFSEVVLDYRDMDQKIRAYHDEPYRAYTKQFDEVVHADDLSTPEELNRLHQSVVSIKHGYGVRLRREIRKDERAFMLFNPEGKGSLGITFLIDNSGSMRGKRTHDCVAWMGIVGELLEQHDISFEVLGYTTRAWKGGQSREQWLLNKKPTNPGRLNDIRHIIYKSFDQNAATLSMSLNLMLREGLLKENIDGEALLWAYKRAVDRDLDRNIIIVLSDGAPVDDSTLAINPADYLENHLIESIQWLSMIDKFSLYGVGIEFDTSRYYPHGITISKSDMIGIELIQSLTKWLSL